MYVAQEYICFSDISEPIVLFLNLIKVFDFVFKHFCLCVLDKHASQRLKWGFRFTPGAVFSLEAQPWKHRDADCNLEHSAVRCRTLLALDLSSLFKEFLVLMSEEHFKSNVCSLPLPMPAGCWA